MEGAAGAPHNGRDGHLVIALGAEQGFAGPFNRRVLDVAERLLKSAESRPAELLLLG
jgi:F-type H+-transporting ATPase subunit gamma